MNNHRPATLREDVEKPLALSGRCGRGFNASASASGKSRDAQSNKRKRAGPD
jgi:hypothetical protein